jgi:subtilisin family serine protease
MGLRKQVVFVAAMLLMVSTTATARQVGDSNQYLIEFNGGVPANFEAMINAAGGTVSHDLSNIGFVTALSDDPGFARNLVRNRAVRDVSRDMIVQWIPESDELQISSAGFEANAFVDPQDAFFGACQWSNAQIDTQAAWDKGYTGQGVKVAVIDSGVDPLHLDMIDKVDEANSRSMISEPDEDCDFYSDLFFGLKDSEVVNDFRFHGAFVAGQIAAHGFGTAGVAPDAEILGIKALNCWGSGSFGDVMAAVMYAADVPGVQVINMSLGAYFEKAPGDGRFLAAMTKAINYANSKGILVVSAAGNDGADLQHDGKMISIPAELGAGLAAWAGDVDGNLALYSNHGVNAAQLGAGGGSGNVESDQIPLPGCVLPEAGQYGIVAPCSTTSIFYNCETGDNYLFGGGGTSFSSPMVAGVAALVDGKYGGAMNAGDLKEVLKMTADDVGAEGTDNEFGHGRVNADMATDY